MIDLNKKYRTRDGNEVIALFHYPENEPHRRILFHVKAVDGTVYTECCYEDGAKSSSIKYTNSSDLILVPTKVKRWFNVYSHDALSFEIIHGEGYSTKDEAKENRVHCGKYIKTICIEVEIP